MTSLYKERALPRPRSLSLTMKRAGGYINRRAKRGRFTKRRSYRKKRYVKPRRTRRMRRVKYSLRRAQNYETELIKLAPYVIDVTSALNGTGVQKCFQLEASRLALSLGTRNMEDYYFFRMKKYMVKMTAIKGENARTDWEVSHPKNIMFFQDPLNQILESSAANLQQNIEGLPFVKKCSYRGAVKKGKPVIEEKKMVLSSGGTTEIPVYYTLPSRFVPTSIDNAYNMYLTSCFLPAWTNLNWDTDLIGFDDDNPDNIVQQQYRVEIWVICEFKGRKPVGG